MSSDQHPAVGRAVCFSLPPFPTESARGYIARVADYNVHELHIDALHHAGVDLKDVLAGRVDAALLDRIYGLDSGGRATLWPQVHGAKGPSIVLVHGVELPSRKGLAAHSSSSSSLRTRTPSTPLTLP